MELSLGFDRRNNVRRKNERGMSSKLKMFKYAAAVGSELAAARKNATVGIIAST